MRCKACVLVVLGPDFGAMESLEMEGKSSAP